MAESIAELARCDIVIQSPKDQRQKTSQEVFSNKNVAIDKLSSINTSAALVVFDLAPTGQKQQKTSDQRLVVEIPDGGSAYEASLSACRRAHARYRFLA